MDSIPQQLLLQVILILINAFFAMTEIAVISLNAGQAPASWRRRATRPPPELLKLVEEPAGFLSTIQIAITLAGFLGSAFAADSFSEYAGGLGVRVTWASRPLSRRHAEHRCRSSSSP